MNDNNFALKKGTKLKDIYTIKKLIGRGGSSFVYLAEKKIGKIKNCGFKGPRGLYFETITRLCVKCCVSNI